LKRGAASPGLPLQVVDVAFSTAKDAIGMAQTPNNEWIVLRVTETNVRIENPDDPEQFVLVDRINRLVFVNGKTKETIVWNRD